MVSCRTNAASGKRALLTFFVAVCVVAGAHEFMTDSTLACWEPTTNTGGGSGCHKLPTSLPCVSSTAVGMNQDGVEPDAENPTKCGWKFCWRWYIVCPCGRPQAVDVCVG